MGPDPRRLRRRRACASGSRCTRPRSPTTSSRRGKTLDAIGHRAGVRDQPRPEPLRPPVPRPGASSRSSSRDRIYHVHVKDSKQAARRPPSRSSARHLELRRARRAAGTSSRPATATSTSRRSSARSTGSATAARSRSSGRTPAWTASGARRTRSRSSAAPTSRRPRSPSTRRCSRSGRMSGAASAPRRAVAGERASPQIGVGMLGYAFMGKAHANAYKTLAVHDLAAAAPAAARLDRRPRTRTRSPRRPQRYGFERCDDRLARARRRSRASSCSTTAGRTTCTPSRRSPRPRPASTSSARSRSAARPTRATRSGRRVAAAGVKHMCAFNYRFVPAIRLAREMIEAGELGEIHHFRGRYLQEWGDDADARHLALRRRRGRARARSATSARTSSTSRATSSARSSPCRAVARTFIAGPRRSTTRSRRSPSSRTAPSGRSRRRRFALGPQRTLQLGDQRLARARSRSTSSG